MVFRIMLIFKVAQTDDSSCPSPKKTKVPNDYFIYWTIKDNILCIKMFSHQIQTCFLFVPDSLDKFPRYQLAHICSRRILNVRYANSEFEECDFVECLKDYQKCCVLIDYK